MIRNYTFYQHNENEIGYKKGKPTREDRLYENIEASLKRIDSKLSLFDESYEWKRYTSYGKGFMQTGENKHEGYEYEKSWDYNLIIIERIKPSRYFGETQKDWFIFQNGGYSELYPELKSYDGCFQWSSKEYSEKDIIVIAKKIASSINDFYIQREKNYREQMAFEQECFDNENFYGGRSNWDDENREFNDMMDDFDAWGNID